MTAALLTAALLTAALICGIRFEKVFPKSTPAYVSIEISESGAGVFKTDPNDELPVKFQLTGDEASRLFAQAVKVDFSQTVDSPAKVAFMGTKTIHYEHGGKVDEAKWNYTENGDARTLADLFEQITETEQDYIELERTAKYDQVGVNDALLGLQVTWEKKRLVAASQFLPLLDRISGSEKYMSLARKRAAALAATFRAQAAAPASETAR